MKVYRSQYWYKNKTWFSDFPVPSDNWENTASNRIAHDKKIFALNTGIHPKNIDKMFSRITDFDKKDWRRILGWTMQDFGSVESNEYNEMVVMS